MRAKHMIRHITEKHLLQDGYLMMQPKIDGMRVLFDKGWPRSRSWKIWTNRYLQAFAQDHWELIQGWDCEMIGGFVPDPMRFREDMSGLRSEDGTREFTLYLFDNFDPSWAIYPYEVRLNACYSDLVKDPVIEAEEISDVLLRSRVGVFKEFLSADYHVKVVLCPTRAVISMDEIDEEEAALLAAGWEGAMLRRKGRGYKWGQSTELEGSLTKVKRFKDLDVEIIGVQPRYRNDNEAIRSELGYQTRSAHQANLVAEECVGSFDVRLVDNPAMEFNVGVFKDVDLPTKQAWWKIRDSLIGKFGKIKAQDYDGGYDKPRTPVWLEFRHKLEM